MNLTWNEAVEAVKRIVPCTRYLEKSPKSTGPDYYCCPLCGSGKGPNGTGAMKYFSDKNLVYCYSCDNDHTEEFYSVIDLHMNDKGEDFATAVRELADGEGIVIIDDDKAAEPRQASKKARNDSQDELGDGYPPEWNKDKIGPNTKPTEDKDTSTRKPNTPYKYKDYCLKCAADVDKTDYLINQGLKPEVYKRYNVGYDTETDQIVFPYNREFSYVTKRKAIKDIDKKDQYRKPTNDEAGNEPLYNPEALYTGEPCFVVEGPIDALSIIQAGGNACAVCGTGETALFEQIKKKAPSAPLIIWKDNDLPNPKTGKRPGQESQANLVERLDKENIPYIEAVYDLDKFELDHGDPNDLMKADSFLFALAVDENIELADTLKEYGPNVGSLLNEIYTE